MMKTNIRLRFRPSTVGGKEGTLYYQLVYGRVVRQISSGYCIFSEEWDNGKSAIVHFSLSPHRTAYLEALERWISVDIQRIEKKMFSIQMQGGSIGSEVQFVEIRNLLLKHSIFEYSRKIKELLRQTGQVRTAETYAAAIHSFARFTGNVDVMLEDLDSEFLQAYEYYLRGTGVTPNTVSFYMCRLRALYNRAVVQYRIEDHAPFRWVYTASEKTVKRAVPLKYIKKLKNLDLSANSSQCYARDIFLFSFYTRGMSFVDIAYLRKSNLHNGVLSYRRQKTGQQLVLHWEPCMQQIVNRYPARSNSDYLFSIIAHPTEDCRRQYKNALCLINRHLKELGKIIGLPVPLTMYVARHSWASIAHHEGIPLSVISQGMGHDSEKTTRIYLASLDTSVIDNANRKIIRLL